MYIGGIQSQRHAEKLAQNRIDNPSLYPADDPYSLSHPSGMKKKQKTFNLVFCKVRMFFIRRNKLNQRRLVIA